MVSHITVSFAFVSFCFVLFWFVLFCFFLFSVRFVVASERNCPMNVCGCGMHIAYISHMNGPGWNYKEKNQWFKRQNAIQCCSTIIQIRYDEFWSVSNAHSIFGLRITSDGCAFRIKIYPKKKQNMWRVICEIKRKNSCLFLNCGKEIFSMTTFW